MSNALQKELDMQSQNLQVCIEYNAFDFTSGVFTVSVCSILEGDDKLIEALYLDNSVNKRLTPSIQVKL